MYKAFFIIKNACCDLVGLFILTVWGITILRAIGLIFDSIYPIPTLIVASFLSLLTFEKRITMILALVGMFLYASSWTIAGKYGMGPGMVIWSIGVGMWFLAVGKSISNTFFASTRVAVGK